MTECVPVPADPTGEAGTLPKADDEALLERLEDLEDILAAAQVDTRNAIPWEDDKAMESGAVSPLRYWRERRGLSQSALAEAAGVPQSDISEIEHGRKPGSVTTFKALARVLGVDIDTLV